MYLMRFPVEDLGHLTIEQLRGREGARVRDAYRAAAEREGVAWTGRRYGTEWDTSNPVNRALSCANACLYGVVHAAIVAVGLSPALGFVHTGKALSFVYDVADLYKCEMTVPLAFRESRGPQGDLDTRVRRACREAFFRGRLLERIVPDAQRLLGIRESPVRSFELSESGELWDPDGPVPSGIGYGA
jgi:CRISPR-associated protein Cas1